MVIPGFKTYREFSRFTGVPLTTVCRHMKKGKCPWPRKIDRRDGRQSHPLYKTWDSMIGRCTLSSNASYPNYGGRGIKVCDRWRSDFVNFVHDMGERPKGHTLDRIDVNGDYTPENCRWATKLIQQSNRQRSSNTGEFCITQNKHGSFIVEVKNTYRGSYRTLNEAKKVRDYYVNLEYK